MIQRIIPSSGELLPAIGLGTWQRFDVDHASAYPSLSEVLHVMHQNSARLIDTSPMYGRAEQVMGELTKSMETKDDFFYATKVWTRGRTEGMAQMEDSLHKMGRASVDLMQIHNLLDWKAHLPVLRDWKAAGKIRYVGITHYTDAMHRELEDVFTREKGIDFVQFNYSVDSRHAEKRLLQAAADAGVATIINRPFGEGALFTKVAGRALPEWALHHQINSWSEFFLQFILLRPEVTCVIPATGNPLHASENFRSGHVNLPVNLDRKRFITCLESL